MTYCRHTRPMLPMPLAADADPYTLPVRLLAEPDLPGRRRVLITSDAIANRGMWYTGDGGSRRTLFTHNGLHEWRPAVQAIARALDYRDLVFDGIAVREGGLDVFVWRDILTGDEWRQQHCPLTKRERWDIMDNLRDTPEFGAVWRLADLRQAVAHPGDLGRLRESALDVGGRGLLLYDPDAKYAFNNQVLHDPAQHRACWRWPAPDTPTATPIATPHQ